MSLDLPTGDSDSSHDAKQAAEALHQANARLASEVRQRTEERDRLRTLFEQAPSFMCLLRGPAHVFELVNDAYLQLVGHRELIGMPIRTALPEVAGQGCFELLDEVYRTGEAFVGRNMSVQVQRAPGGPLEQRWLHLIYQPVLAPDGRVSGIFVDGHDVTQQKHAEDALQAFNVTLEQRVAQRTEQLAAALERLRAESAERESMQAVLRHAQRMESIGATTGGIAHDFNNLLQVISSNLQLLGRYVAGNEQARMRVQNALAGVSRGAELAAQLLAFGRRQPLDALSDRSGAPELGGNETVLVVEDDEQVREAAVAIVSELGYRVLKAHDAASALRVIESGVPLDVLFTDVVMPGPLRSTEMARIARERLPNLAVLFTSSYTENGIVHGDRLEPGVDLLPKPYTRELLARELRHVINRQAQRRLALDSGALARTEPDSAAAAPLPPQAPDGACGPRLTVLLVEDDELVRQSVAVVLAAKGHVVHEASNAVSALKALAAQRFDVLMADIGLPGPSGVDLARQAVERWPGLAVIFATGNREAADAAQVPGAAVLVKPYLPEDVSKVLAATTGLRQ